MRNSLPLHPGETIQFRPNRTSGRQIFRSIGHWTISLPRDDELVVNCRPIFHSKASLPVVPKTRPDKPERPTRPKRTIPPGDIEQNWPVDVDQSFRYADASRDRNPIHLDAEFAQTVGLGDVILHGLCTMAMSGRSVLELAGDGQPGRLKRLSVRFSKPVRNGSP